VRGAKRGGEMADAELMLGEIGLQSVVDPAGDGVELGVDVEAVTNWSRKRHAERQTDPVEAIAA
jgi:hypothetical protein